jgi:hypothetical protein
VALELDHLGAGGHRSIDELERLANLAFVIDADFDEHQGRVIRADFATSDIECHYFHFLQLRF